MDRAEIESKIKKIIVDQLDVTEDQITNEASFVDDLGADSLDTVELVMSIEEEFDCQISDDQAESIQTVQNAIDHVEEFLSQS